MILFHLHSTEQQAAVTLMHALLPKPPEQELHPPVRARSPQLRNSGVPSSGGSPFAVSGSDLHIKLQEPPIVTSKLPFLLYSRVQPLLINSGSIEGGCKTFWGNDLA